AWVSYNCLCPHRSESLRPCTSANHLVREEEQRCRHRDPQCLGGLEVEDQLELHRLLHGQVAWLGPFEDLIDIGGGASGHVRPAWAIRHETTSLDPPPRIVDRWESILGREVHNPLQVKQVNIAWQYDHRLGTLADRGGKCPLIVVGLSHREELQLDAQC